MSDLRAPRKRVKIELPYIYEYGHMIGYIVSHNKFDWIQRTQRKVYTVKIYSEIKTFNTSDEAFKYIRQNV